MRVSITLVAILACGLTACSPRVNRAKEAVGDLLKDPASAQFRDVYAQPSGVVCGEVNAKNSYGGYVGFRRFAVDTRLRALIEAEDGDAIGGPEPVGDGFPETAVNGFRFFDLVHIQHCLVRQ